MKYLKLYKYDTDYQNYVNSDDYIIPNVSYAKDTDIVYYNVVKETRVVCTYNVTDTTNSTQLCYNSTDFTSMEVDGVLLDNATTGYTFDTVGEHTVKFDLADTTTLRNMPFLGCKSITSVVIPDSVTYIGSYSFQGSGLITAKIGSGGASIGESAFNSCSNLTSVEIISGIIGERAFQYCFNLTSVKIKAGSIKSYAFPGCSSITSLELGEGVTEIGVDAFAGCSSLTSLIVPDSVTYIGDDAFRGCYNITSLELGTGLIEIGRAFENCQNLSEITCFAVTPPSIDSYTFWNVKQNGILKVPTGSDYSSWMSTDSYYLGYYNWTVQEI